MITILCLLVPIPISPPVVVSTTYGVFGAEVGERVWRRRLVWLVLIRAVLLHGAIAEVENTARNARLLSVHSLFWHLAGRHDTRLVVRGLVSQHSMNFNIEDFN